ncbi:MAG: sulfate ABC transporter ATP-binding protein, partial [Pseudonocardiales bacterium]
MALARPTLQPAAQRHATPVSSVRVTQLAQVFERDRPPVLDRIDFDVAPGEFVCLLGASGCGKSTLLSLIAGLGTPTSGSIEVTVGRPALMFQEPALLPWLTAAGNV